VRSPHQPKQKKQYELSDEEEVDYGGGRGGRGLSSGGRIFHATDAAIAGQVKVELGWKLCAQGGLGGGPGGEGVWEAAAVLISGQKVREKNLQESHYYKIRVRYVLPGSTATAAAQGKGRA
jgi:hypothetical protein